MSETSGGDGFIRRLVKRSPFTSKDNPGIPMKEKFSFPSKAEFQRRYDRFYGDLEHPQHPRETATPPCNEETATLENVVKFAQADWLDLKNKYDKRNGQNPFDYLYDISQFLAKPYSQTGHYQRLSLREDWSIANGRHRILALKLLGEEALSGLPHLKEEMHLEVQKIRT